MHWHLLFYIAVLSITFSFLDFVNRVDKRFGQQSWLNHWNLCWLKSSFLLQSCKSLNYNLTSTVLENLNSGPGQHLPSCHKSCAGLAGWHMSRDYSFCRALPGQWLGFFLISQKYRKNEGLARDIFMAHTPECLLLALKLPNTLFTGEVIMQQHAAVVFNVIASCLDSVVAYWMIGMTLALFLATYLHIINLTKRFPFCNKCGQGGSTRENL